MTNSILTDKRKIVAPPEAEYMSHFMTDLPDYTCYFNKTLCGVGGTSLVLANDIPYIILVPYVSLVEGKLNQTNEDGSLKYPNVQPVMEGISAQDVRDMKNKGITKFISTYHGFSKINKAFDNYDRKKFKLLVDEAHMLISYDDKDFNHDVVQEIYNNYEDYKSTCFMTATPNADDCLPDCMYKHPYVTIQWDNVQSIKLKTQKVANNMMSEYVYQLLCEHLLNMREGRPYLFYNSVDTITSLCRLLIESNRYKPEDICIIAADKNDGYLKKYGHKDLKIDSVTELNERVKRKEVEVVFVTAKCFEGNDLFDEDGVIYVISDGRKKHTRLDIHTQIPQIVNRIRNSRFKEQANLLYTNSITNDCRTREEVKEFVIDQCIKHEDVVEMYKNSKGLARDMLNRMDEIQHSEFLTFNKEHMLITNPNAMKRSLNMWEAYNSTYNVRLDKEHISNTESRATFLEILNEQEVNNIEYFNRLSEQNRILLGKQTSFRRLCKDYIKDLENGESIEFYEKHNDLFYKLAKLHKNKEERVAFLGTCKYQQKELQRRLDAEYSYQASEKSIKDYLDLQEGKFYSNAEIKEKLNKYCEINNIRKKIKATELETLYSVKKTQLRVCGKPTNGYIILSSTPGANITTSNYNKIIEDDPIKIIINRMKNARQGSRNNTLYGCVKDLIKLSITTAELHKHVETLKSICDFNGLSNEEIDGTVASALSNARESGIKKINTVIKEQVKTDYDLTLDSLPALENEKELCYMPVLGTEDKPKCLSDGYRHMTKEEALEYPGVSFLAENIAQTKYIVIDCDNKEAVKLFKPYLDKTKSCINEDGTSAHLTFITDKLIPNKRIKTDTIALDLLGNDVKSQLRFLKSNKVDNGKKPIKITQEILDIINNI